MNSLYSIYLLFDTGWDPPTWDKQKTLLSLYPWKEENTLIARFAVMQQPKATTKSDPWRPSHWTWMAQKRYLLISCLCYRGTLGLWLLGKGNLTYFILISTLYFQTYSSAVIHPYISFQAPTYAHWQTQEPTTEHIQITGITVEEHVRTSAYC